MELIVAMDSRNGIGYKGNIPWYCSEDLKHFRATTLNSTIIVGRKTAETLPVLKKRRVLCLTRGSPDSTDWKCKVCFIHSLTDIKSREKETVIIAGGAQVYESAIKTGQVRRIYRTIIKGVFECDTYFNLDWLNTFVITKEEISPVTGNVYQVLEKLPILSSSPLKEPRHHEDDGEYQYLNLLRDVYTNGTVRKSRNGDTKALFMNTMRFDLRVGFPLLTTKKMFMRGILEEFLFFLRGETDSTILSNARVKIWEGNTSKAFLASQSLPYAPGVMGPMYGYQWRHFNAPYIIDKEGRPISPKGGIDQLSNVINLIKNDPHSRRILMTSYNPAQAAEGVLYPCHSIIIQFYVQDQFLDMSCYNRSQDLFLGVPYNIASSALLLSTVAKLTDKKPRYLSMVMGDTHLYSCHTKQAILQQNRIPYSPPSLEMPNIKNIGDILKLKASDFNLTNYKSHKTIKALMVA